MKKIYLFLAFLFLIRLVDGQNCSPKNVPYSFTFKFDSCTSTSYTSGTNYYYWLNNPTYGLSMYATAGDSQYDSWYFTEGINLVKGKKYLVYLSYGGDLDNDLKFGFGTSKNANSMTIYHSDFYMKCSQNYKIVEITALDSGVYYFGICCSYLTDQTSIHVGNVSIKESICPKITKQPVSSISDTSVQLNWTSNVPSSSYEVFYTEANSDKLKCFSSAWGTIISSSKDSLILTNLRPSTKYYYTIRSKCDSLNYGLGTSIDSFTTICLPKKVPYNESFNSGYFPPCMSTQLVNANSYNWDLYNISQNNYCVGIYSSSQKNSDAWFYTQQLPLDSGKTYRLSFNYFASDTNKIQSLEVKYGLSANSIAMNNLIANFTSFSAPNYPKIYSTIFTPITSGNYYFGFHNYDNISTGNFLKTFYIDDISITDNNILFVNCFIDNNTNNIKDLGEKDFTDAQFITQKNGYSPIVTATSSGYAIVNIDTGTYTTKVVHNLPYYTTSPLVHTTSNTNFLQIDTAIFAIQPIPGKRDLSVHLIPLNNARPGFTANYKLSFTNQGTDTVLSGIVQMILDSRISFNSATPAPTSISGDTLRWSFSNVIPSATSNVYLTLACQSPPTLNLNDLLTFSATVTSEKPDLTPIDDSTTLNQIVRGSYDPNDKTESHGGSILKSDVDNGEFLQYTIRFQNTGNDTAFNVIIKDTLESKLDWSSFRMLDASHNYQLTITEDNKCEWIFKNINLPDSNVNEKFSHGFVTYIVKIKPSVSVGNIVANKAAIYFDYNLPLLTNTEYTNIVANTLPLRLLSFSANISSSPQVANENARKVILRWNTANEVNLDRFEVEKSSNVREFETIGKVKAGLSNYTFSDNKLLTANAFYYRLKMIDKDGKFTYSHVEKVSFGGENAVRVYPNPAREKINVVGSAMIAITLRDHVGRVVIVKAFSATNSCTLNITGLPRGMYVLQIKDIHENVQVEKLVVE